MGTRRAEWILVHSPTWVCTQHQSCAPRRPPISLAAFFRLRCLGWHLASTHALAVRDETASSAPAVVSQGPGLPRLERRLPFGIARDMSPRGLRRRRSAPDWFTLARLAYSPVLPSCFWLFYRMWGSGPRLHLATSCCTRCRRLLFVFLRRLRRRARCCAFRLCVAPVSLDRSHGLRS